MSALRTHLEGDCWSPCHYCHVEDLMPQFLEPTHPDDIEDDE